MQTLDLQGYYASGSVLSEFKMNFSMFLAVVVIQNATVHDLKKAIQRHISLKLSREGGPNIVSW